MLAYLIQLPLKLEGSIEVGYKWSILNVFLLGGLNVLGITLIKVINLLSALLANLGL